MKCTRSDGDGVVVLRIEASLDALSVGELRPLLDAVVRDQPRRVTLHVEALTLIDSSGIGAIVSLYKRVKASGGDVVVVGARDQPLAVLRLLKLDRVFAA